MASFSMEITQRLRIREVLSTRPRCLQGAQSSTQASEATSTYRAVLTTVIQLVKKYFLYMNRRFIAARHRTLKQ
jgi:hypothetical protein